MRRDARAAAAATLAALAIAAALTPRRRPADPDPMTPKPHAIQQHRPNAMLAPGALVVFHALPPGRQLVEVLVADIGPDVWDLRVRCERTRSEFCISTSTTFRGWTLVRPAPTAPNVLTEADMDLLRTRVDQRG